jgi:hypothetical protein
VVHFVASAITHNYISNQVGSQAGQIVAKGILRAFDGEKESDEIYKNMKDESESVMSRWNKANFLIFLPAGPLLNPLFKKINDRYLYKPYLSGDLTRDQLSNRGRLIDKTRIGINSLVFGLLIFFAAKFFLYFKGKKTQQIA